MAKQAQSPARSVDRKIERSGDQGSVSLGHQAIGESSERVIEPEFAREPVCYFPCSLRIGPVGGERQ